MKKQIFRFERGTYKDFEAFLFNYMPVNKCKDIYIIINCIKDLYDYIQFNGNIQKTCSKETPAYIIVRNIMYWYMDWLDDFRFFIYDNCCCDEMTVEEEEVRYEKILKTLKKYTARKSPELNDFFGGTDMKKHNEKGELTEKEVDNLKIWYDYVTKKYFLGEIGTFNKLVNEVRDLGLYKIDRETGSLKVPFEPIGRVNAIGFDYDPTDYMPLHTHIACLTHNIGNKILSAIDYPQDFLACDEFMNIINEMERIQEFPPFDFDDKEKFIYEIEYAEESTSPEPITDPEEVTRATLLDAAKKCVCSDRNKQYGSPEDNFGIIARYWKEYLGCDITAMDVGIMMTLFKIGRMQSGGYKPDNFVDAIGYLACAGEWGAKFNIDDGDKCGYGKCTDCWTKGEEV